MEVYSKYRQKTVTKKGRAFPVRRVGVFLLIFTTALLILLKVATWLNAQELFQLKKITIEGNQFVKRLEILNLVQIDSSANLLEFDLQKISTRVKQHPLIDKVLVSRRLPSTLVIKLQEKEPLAILNDSELVAVDEKGNVMPEFQTEMLFDTPIISNLTQNSESFQQVLDFLSFTKSRQFSLYLEISEISYSKNLGIYFFLNEKGIPVICGDDDFENKGEKFLTVLTFLKSVSKLQTVKYFDLRFKDQVIVRELES